MKKKKNISLIIILFVILLLPIIPLFHTGLPVTHDGQDHVARIANFYQSISEGALIPRWAGNLNWGYGHPILMFLYPLPSYVASLFHAFGLSFVDSTKAVFITMFVASGLSMYLWLTTAFGKRAGVIGAILYSFAPYRFVDLSVRGAIGEHTAFVFPPLILFFLYKLAKEKQFGWYGIGLSVSFAGLILSHNALLLMFLPIIMLYGIFIYFTEANRSILYLVKCFGFASLGIGLSAFFLFPAYLEGKYTLRDIVTDKEYASRFVPWTWLVYSPWNYGQTDTFTKSLGVGLWMGVLYSVYWIWKVRKKSTRVLLVAGLLSLVASLMMTTDVSLPIWRTISILQKFQFPWRFLSVAVFLAAFLGAIAIDEFAKHNKHTDRYIILFCILAIGTTIGMWKPKSYQMKPESFYSGIYESTTDTGESSPIWSVRFMEHRPTAHMEIISGSVTVAEVKRSSTVHEYLVTASDSARLVENTLFFPGWKVYVDGVGTGIQYQDPAYRGLITFRVAEGVHTVRIIFEDTKLRKVSDIISLISFGIVIALGLGTALWKRKQ